MTDKLSIPELEKITSKELVEELIFEYSKTRTSFWSGDITKTIIHSARFCEICIAVLKIISEQTIIVDLNNIEFGKFYDQLLKLPKTTAKEEMLYLVIPQALKIAYTIRSKKRVAHIKLTNAELIDAEFVTTTCNWVVTQLIIIFLQIPIEETISLTNSLMERKIPTIEQFDDGEIMVLKKGLKLDDELLLVLYQYPRRINREELNAILKPKKSSYISTYLNLLYNDKLIHLNGSGAIINKNGIKEIENNVEKYFT